MKKYAFSTENDLFENQENPYLIWDYFERFRTHLMSVSELWNCKVGVFPTIASDVGLPASLGPKGAAHIS